MSAEWETEALLYSCPSMSFNKRFMRIFSQQILCMLGFNLSFFCTRQRGRVCRCVKGHKLFYIGFPKISHLDIGNPEFHKHKWWRGKDLGLRQEWLRSSASYWLRLCACVKYKVNVTLFLIFRKCYGFSGTRQTCFRMNMQGGSNDAAWSKNVIFGLRLWPLLGDKPQNTKNVRSKWKIQPNK